MLSYSFLVEKALQKALELHHGQVRKHDDKTPFIVHPIGVTLFLAQFTHDPNILCAALLHDTLEDTHYTKEQLKRDFGKKIATIVEELTEPPRSRTPWKKRKECYIKHLKTASPAAQMICCADKINNLASMVEAYKKQGKIMWTKFNSDKSLWYYEEIFKILNEKLPMAPFVDIYRLTLQEARHAFGS